MSQDYRDVVLALGAAGLVALIGHYCGRFLHWAEHRLTHRTIRPHTLTPDPPEPQSFVPNNNVVVSYVPSSSPFHPPQFASTQSSIDGPIWNPAMQNAYDSLLSGLGAAGLSQSASANRLIQSAQALQNMPNDAGNWFARHGPKEEDFFRGAK